MNFLEVVEPGEEEEKPCSDQVPNKEGSPLPIVVPSIECPVRLYFRDLNDNESHYHKCDKQIKEHEAICLPPERCDEVVHLRDDTNACDE